uniref:uncharacterized protein isoform X1 n=1 Tax=Myxine glutinosa TaxID=7769 RepID=UPI00358F996A
MGPLGQCGVADVRSPAGLGAARVCVEGGNGAGATPRARPRVYAASTSSSDVCVYTDAEFPVGLAGSAPPSELRLCDRKIFSYLAVDRNSTKPDIAFN